MNEKEKQQKPLREYLEDDRHQDIQELIDDVEGNVRRPPRNDPRHADESVPRGGRDVPAGGSTGEYMGGSAKKRKGQTG